MAKATEKIERWRAEHPGRPWFTLEFLPMKSDLNITSLYELIDKMSLLNPLWINVTWAGASLADRTLEICTYAQKYHGLDVMMHLTCTNTEQSKLHDALMKCKENGIANILAVRGEPPHPATGAGKPADERFIHAIDLVKYIKENFDDQFCIAVAGSPEGHVEAESKEKDLEHLREKVDAGADLIITQHFYDNSEFFAFAERVKSAGIKVPLVPGIMPIHSYTRFLQMSKAWKTKVPAGIFAALEAVKEENQKVKDYGVELGVRMCRELQEKGSPGFHFYTFNGEVPTSRIVQKLGLQEEAARGHRPRLPWRPSVERRRSSEDVRPVYWSQRPLRSYLLRTAAWEDFPQGRFEKPSSAFSEPCSLVMPLTEKACAERRLMWGETPSIIDDISEVFAGYFLGSVRRIPWSQGLPREESQASLRQLASLCRRRLLIINAQQRVNGAPSTDLVVGWGPPNGFVYSKAYLEFFAPPDVLTKLVEGLSAESRISYVAATRAGDVETNLDTKSVNAIAWGMFPGTQVQQPIVADYQSFLAWKDEAFALWSEWTDIYDKASPARQLVESIQGSWYLTSLVDDNFVAGDIMETLARALGCEDTN